LTRDKIVQPIDV